MNTAALLTLVATILGVEGSIVQVDIGSAGGLHRGDAGTIYFEVAAEDHVHTVDVGPATVIAVADERAALGIASDLVVKTDYLVRFEILEERLANDTQDTPDQSSAIATATVRSNADPCLRLRALPGSFSQSVECMTPGSTLDVFETVGSWSRGRLPDGRQGWAANDFLDTTSRTFTESASRRQVTGTTDYSGSSAEVSERMLEVEAALEESEKARRDLLLSLEDPTGVAAPGSTELNVADESIRELQEQLLRSESELYEAQKNHETIAAQVAERTVEQLEARLEESASVAREAEIARRALQSEVTDLVAENENLRLRLATAETLRDEATREQDRLLTELRASQPVSPEERQALQAESASREAQLAASRDSLRQAEARILELQGELDALVGIPDAGDAGPSEPKRGGRWKFWRKPKSGDDDSGSSEQSDESAGGNSEGP